jgi:hypothetical protein
MQPLFPKLPSGAAANDNDQRNNLAIAGVTGMTSLLLLLLLPPSTRPLILLPAVRAAVSGVWLTVAQPSATWLCHSCHRSRCCASEASASLAAAGQVKALHT